MAVVVEGAAGDPDDCIMTEVEKPIVLVLSVPDGARSVIPLPSSTTHGGASLVEQVWVLDSHSPSAIQSSTPSSNRTPVDIFIDFRCPLDEDLAYVRSPRGFS